MLLIKSEYTKHQLRIFANTAKGSIFLVANHSQVSQLREVTKPVHDTMHMVPMTQWYHQPNDTNKPMVPTTQWYQWYQWPNGINDPMVSMTQWYQWPNGTSDLPMVPMTDNKTNCHKSSRYWTKWEAHKPCTHTKLLFTTSDMPLRSIYVHADSTNKRWPLSNRSYNHTCDQNEDRILDTLNSGHLQDTHGMVIIKVFKWSHVSLRSSRST